MAKCSFCKETIEKGTGKIYVLKTGKILYFCSSKCEKNMLKLKRKPRTTRWTKEYEEVKERGKK
jgi:large subunit ribosomal protein L24e